MKGKIFIVVNLILPFIIITTQLLSVGVAFAQKSYQLLEPIPFYGTGELKSTDLDTYLETVFAFGISLAGILAVLMIVIGGIEYITAYGNTGRTENAKNRITQALIGLLLAICAYLILYTINPDLIKGSLDISKYKL